MRTNDPARIPDFEAPPGDTAERAPLRIFINYRHEDMPFALYRELKGRFGAENIFFDAGALRPVLQSGFVI